MGSLGDLKNCLKLFVLRVAILILKCFKIPDSVSDNFEVPCLITCLLLYLYNIIYIIYILYYNIIYIYYIPCTGCTADCIGTTKRPLKNRIRELIKDVYNAPDKWTALTKHAWHQDHTLNFHDDKILDRSKFYKKRMTLEITHIASNPCAVNQRTDLDNLSVFYLPLFNDKIQSHLNYISLTSCLG